MLYKFLAVCLFLIPAGCVQPNVKERQDCARICHMKSCMTYWRCNGLGCKCVVENF